MTKFVAEKSGYHVIVLARNIVRLIKPY